MPSPLDELERIVREAGGIATSARENLQKEFKPDESIVTNGDRAVEEFLRPHLTRLVPGTGVWGEEFGRDEPGKAGLWLVDPIDGTSNYSFGSPLWGVSVGLIVSDKLELGCVCLPDLDETFLSARGEGVRLNGRPLLQIPPGPVRPHELFSVGDWAIRKFPHVAWPGRLRCSGAFVIDGTFAISQRYRALAGFNERLYDVAPCILFGLELGAEVRYLSGEPMDFAELAAGGTIDRPWLIAPRDCGFLVRV